MSYVTYTKTGPFTDANPPGLSASFFNAIETMLAAGWFDSAITSDGAGNHSASSYTSPFDKLNPIGTILNGSTSGTAMIYQPQRGTWKEVFIVLSNFRNAGGSTQTLAIPVPFTTFCRAETGNMFQVALQVGASAQTVKILTGLAATGGSVTLQAYIAANSIGTCLAAVDTIGFLNGDTVGQSSIMYLRGV